MQIHKEKPSFDKTPDGGVTDLTDAAEILCQTQDILRRRVHTTARPNINPTKSDEGDLIHDLANRRTQEQNIDSSQLVDDLLSGYLISQPSFDLGFDKGDKTFLIINVFYMVCALQGSLGFHIWLTLCILVYFQTNTRSYLYVDESKR